MISHLEAGVLLFAARVLHGGAVKIPRDTKGENPARDLHEACIIVIISYILLLSTPADLRSTKPACIAEAFFLLAADVISVRVQGFLCPAPENARTESSDHRVCVANMITTDAKLRTTMRNR